MRKVDILIAKLKAKQTIRKVKEARAMRQMEIQNATTNQRIPIQSEQSPEGQGMELQPLGAPNLGNGLGGNNGVSGQP